MVLGRCVNILERFYPSYFVDDGADENQMWSANVRDALVELEKSGIEELQGVGEFLDTQDDRPAEASEFFSFKVDHRFGLFFDAVYESEKGTRVKAIEAISRAQKKRLKEGRDFLSSLFDF